MQSGTINNEGNDLKTYDSESSLVRGGGFQREEGAVVSHLTFPMTVEIVGHDVEKVDVLDHFGNIVTGSNGFRAGRDGSRQQETWQFVGNGFSLKGQTKFFDQIEEGRPVIRTSANFSKNTQIKMEKKRVNENFTGNLHNSNSYLGYSQSMSKPSKLLARRNSVESYTNWFMRKMFEVRSLKGPDPTAQPPMAKMIFKSGFLVRRFWIRAWTSIASPSTATLTR